MSSDALTGSGDAPSIPVTVEEMTIKSAMANIQGDFRATSSSNDSTLPNMRFEAGDSVSSALPAAPLLARSGIRPIVPNMTMQADLASPVIQSATVPVRTDHLVPPSPNRILSNMCIAEPKPRLPTFNGKQDWDAFYVQFEFLAAQFGWDTNKQLSYLMAGLQDGALEYVSKLPSTIRMNLPDLIKSLKRRFGDSVLPETHRAALDFVKKDTKENLREYAARVGELMSKAYPGLEGSDLFTSMLIDRIVRGLPDPALVYDVLSKRPKTVDMALDAIEWHECIKNCKKKTVNTRRLAEEETYNVREVSSSSPYVTESRLKDICADIKESLLEVLQKGNVTPYSQGRGGRHTDFGGEYGAVPGSREFNPQRMPGGQASKYVHSREGGRRQEAFNRDVGRSRLDDRKRYIPSTKQRIEYRDQQGSSFKENEKERRNAVATAKSMRNRDSLPMRYGKENNVKLSNRNFQGECYVCHEFGHMAQDCAMTQPLN